MAEKKPSKTDRTPVSNKPRTPKTAKTANKKQGKPDRSQETGDADRAWKIAQLAATLATRHPFHSFPWGQARRPFPDLSMEARSNQSYEARPDLDDFYISLLQRAEFLLLRAENKIGGIHACEIFTPNRTYTVSEIASEFTRVGWQGLKSENTIRSLLREARAELRRCVKEQREYLENYQAEVMHSTDGLENQSGHEDQSSFAGFEAIKEKLGYLSLMDKWISEYLGNEDSLPGELPVHNILVMCKDCKLLSDRLITERANLTM